jgi:hypothetical protein
MITALLNKTQARDHQNARPAFSPIAVFRLVGFSEHDQPAPCQGEYSVMQLTCKHIRFLDHLWIGQVTDFFLGQVTNTRKSHSPSIRSGLRAVFLKFGDLRPSHGRRYARAWRVQPGMGIGCGAYSRQSVASRRKLNEALESRLPARKKRPAKRTNR